jgi:hypothetical protein
MSREAECRELINQLGELNKVKSLLLADIAVSLAQIADKLNTHITVVTLDSKTVVCAYDEARGLIGGRGGE